MTNPSARGGNRFTNNLPPGEYSKGQLAEEVGMPYDTLRRWLRNGTYVPHESGRDERRGDLPGVVHIFTDEDVTALRKLCKQRGVKHRARSRRRNAPADTADDEHHAAV